MQSILIVIIRQCGQNKRNYGFNIQSISKDHFMNKISELSKDNSTSLMKEIASNEILMTTNMTLISSILMKDKYSHPFLSESPCIIDKIG